MQTDNRHITGQIRNIYDAAISQSKMINIVE